MGKNPHAKRLKEKKHKEKEFGVDMESLTEEAARRGCEIWELDEIRKEQDELSENSDSQDSDS